VRFYIGGRTPVALVALLLLKPRLTVEGAPLPHPRAFSRANIGLHPAMTSGRTPELGRFDMTHSNLKVDVQGTKIVVVLRGTCFRAKYRKQEAPWLATDEYGPDDQDAPMTLSEFRKAAWAAANDAARELGWIKSCGELHQAAGPH
jgi:hypothetical protein